MAVFEDTNECPTSEMWELPSLSLQAIMMEAAARWKRKETSSIFRSSSANDNNKTLLNIWILVSRSSLYCTPNVCHSSIQELRIFGLIIDYRNVDSRKFAVTFFIHSITRVLFRETLLFATNLKTKETSQQSIFSDNFTKLKSRILLKLLSYDIICILVIY